MSDGNTYAISKHLDEREDWDALQEVTSELEQAEARIEELEAKLKAAEEIGRAFEEDAGQLREKLAKAVEFIEDLTGCEWPYCEDAKRVLAELKGQDDE